MRFKDIYNYILYIIFFTITSECIFAKIDCHQKLFEFSHKKFVCRKDIFNTNAILNKQTKLQRG